MNDIGRAGAGAARVTGAARDKAVTVAAGVVAVADAVAAVGDARDLEAMGQRGTSAGALPPMTVRDGWIKLPERGRRVRWTAALTGLFMDELARTGNVYAAARLLGIDPSQAYYRARTNDRFAAAWQMALDAGYRTIETMIIGHILAGGDAARRAAGPEGGKPTFDLEQALRTLALQERRMAGRTVKPSGRRQTADGVT
jgi:hypothetical protein